MNLDFQDYHDLYKVIVIGDSGTGKTNLIHLYIKNVPCPTCDPTVGIQYYSKYVEIEGNRKVKVQIWDTAGQQRFRSVTMGHYKKAVGALILFDITNRKSFERVPIWLNSIRQRCEQDVKIGLIGNKTDLDRRQITSQEAQKLARQQGMFYMETSIYDQNATSLAFHKLIEQIYKRKKEETLEFSKNNIDLEKIPHQEEDSCKC